MLLATLIGIPIGVLAATHQYSWLDNSSMFLSLFCVSMPSFWFALILVMIFCQKLGVLPAAGVDTWKGYILPCVSCALGGAAGIARQTRSSMLEVIRQDNITTARAKGQKESKVIFEHALKNALIPMLNYSFEAICMLDREGRLTTYNEQASKMFKPSGEASYLGRHFSDLVPAVSRERLNDLLREGKSCFSRIIEAGNEVGMLNVTCNFKNGEPNGAVVHFTTIRKIEEMESQVKTELYQKGHVAKYRFSDIVGRSEPLLRAKHQAERFSKYNSNILLFGESGCGKELFAQGIHNASMRRSQPFVAVNCGSLPTNLLESELFGYVDGAFTGALKKGKKGLFEIANKGTIFLDEISEMDLQGQSRLLRVLEEREIMRIGDDKVIPVDVRVISATNRDLLQMVEAGTFREDLYYRLNILSLIVPPLRERGSDVILLAESFLDKFGKRYQKHLVLSDAAKAALLACPWKGNVRQLRNFCERLVILADQREISEELIREGLGSTSYTRPSAPAAPAQKAGRTQEDEKTVLLRALEQADGKREKAAELLGISKSTLWRKMKKYEIE